MNQADKMKSQLLKSVLLLILLTSLLHAQNDESDESKVRNKSTKNELVPVEIISDPPGAEIIIDDSSQGTTDSTLFLPPGEYKIQLILAGYTPVTTKIKVTAGKKLNRFRYTLSKNPGQLKLMIGPKTAAVRLNNEIINHKEIQALAPGIYQIEVEAEHYYPVKRSFEIELGKTNTIKICLVRKMGRLQFSVNPPDANCVLSLNSQVVERWRGKKSFDQLPEEVYNLTVKAKGRKTYNGTVRIDANRTTIETIKLEFGDEVPDWMVSVKGGTFTMGCTSDGETNCNDNEKPAHSVTLGDFYISKYEVTLGLFSEFIQETGYITNAEKAGGSYIRKDDKWVIVQGVNWRCGADAKARPQDERMCPVVNVSWFDAVAFCNWLSEKEGLQKAYSGTGSSIVCDFTSNGYRLPTEAEWEFAARGGKSSENYIFSGSNTMEEVGWYNLNSGNENHETGTKKPNELGLFDMSGNVWEWCWDRYAGYSTAAQGNPRGPLTGDLRVARSGSEQSDENQCRVSYRIGFSPNSGYVSGGFRLAKTR
ncbi:MAG: SUMF1/EgtB/PvdO family nonheme iron enzyme [Ignavibacteriaceae bacterium]|nr:MAG: SUMF1/EgtB/PvdO family nonheme iron enzyme [Ignavibacteriaceae bacterium]OQY76017.1 MAG: hypothetical protein B6D45_04765 [Ignavibacteriales bacterium UTCHB3]